MHEEDLNETVMESDGPPVLPFLPPTEEPSTLVLVISVVLVGCLTIGICGNASQIVLQIPLGLPSVVLEKLVRVWMFGRLSCHAYYILATAGRVLTPWCIAVLHAFVALFLSPPNRLSRFEGGLSLVALLGMLLLALTYILPEGMTAKLELVRKDEIDSEQYIMLIHTYRCSKYQILPPTEEGMKFGFEFIAPLLLSVVVHVLIRSTMKLNSRLAISRNLDLLISVAPEDVDLQQLLPFFSPTIIWYPLSQLSAALSRYSSSKIEDDRSRSRNPGTASETERAELMGGQVIV
ncbi:hypothetical protein RB195_000810 [Necator americanus]|uniref:Uncharacterized protein n=1 Tax=Necator americanus TaxID=51031 RepID=A0ABR1DD68_NECAM